MITEYQQSSISPLPSKQYSILYADPPWSYQDHAHAGERGVTYKYPTLSDTDLLRLPISTITTEDAALFLWATAPRLPFALDVLTAWGFIYKTVAFTWIKTTNDGKGVRWGMGNWTRANPEFILLGVKGKPQRLSASVHSVIHAPLREHSRKPDEVRHRIEQLLGDLPRIELFAREQVQGWDAWGLDVGEKVTV